MHALYLKRFCSGLVLTEIRLFHWSCSMHLDGTTQQLLIARREVTQ